MMWLVKVELTYRIFLPVTGCTRTTGCSTGGYLARASRSWSPVASLASRYSVQPLISQVCTAVSVSR
ncbi:hypothetical protein D3C71_1648160 [compost metagenome]